MARPRDRPGGRAFRCTWDIKKLCGHQGSRLVHKGTSLYALARSCGPLSCTCIDPPDDADNTICLYLLWTTRNIHKCFSESHDQGHVPVRNKITLETRQINTMVGCFCAAGPAPDLRHKPTGSTHFCKQNVGVGYTRSMYIISILFRVYPVDVR